jgi:hypothetical protein
MKAVVGVIAPLVTLGTAAVRHHEQTKSME